MRDEHESPPPDEAGDGGGPGMREVADELREVGDGTFFNGAADTNPDNDVREP